MKLNKLSALLAASTLLAASSSAMAWESADGQHSTSASVALSSDYMWRGISQTDNEIAISGSFDYAHASGFYLGTWASNVDFGTDASTEIDIYAGFGSDIGDTGFNYDIGALEYIFPGDSATWLEYHASLGYSILTATVNYSSNGFSNGKDSFYYTLDAAYDLPIGVSLAAGVGFYDGDNAAAIGSGDPKTDNYTNYHVGISKEFAGFGWDLTYVNTDKDAEKAYGKNLSDGRLVFTISKSM